MFNPIEGRMLFAGLHAGDALGATSEFLSLPATVSLYENAKGKGWPFVPLGGGVFGWRPGEPTDDTDMAQAVLQAVRRADGKFDPELVAEEFCSWLASGPPDAGGTTRRTIGALRNGKAWYEAGFEEYQRNPKGAANGSLMRNGVIAACADTADEAFRYTVQHSMMTHFAPLPVLCCAIQTYLLFGLLSESEEEPFAIGDWLQGFFREWAGYIKEEQDPYVRQWLQRVDEQDYNDAVKLLEQTWNEGGFHRDWCPYAEQIAGQGYVLTTLQIAVWAMQWAVMDEPYDKAPFPEYVEPLSRTGPNVLGWVALIGRDADTYGAAAGPLVAAILPDLLPNSMTDKLEALAWFDRVWPSPSLGDDRLKHYKRAYAPDGGRNPLTDPAPGEPVRDNPLDEVKNHEA